MITPYVHTIIETGIGLMKRIYNDSDIIKMLNDSWIDQVLGLTDRKITKENLTEYKKIFDTYFKNKTPNIKIVKYVPKPEEIPDILDIYKQQIANRNIHNDYDSYDFSNNI